MKVLKEDNDNPFAKKIREVEDLMRKNNVSIHFMGSRTLVCIEDKELWCDSADFPRVFDDERIYLD